MADDVMRSLHVAIHTGDIDQACHWAKELAKLHGAPADRLGQVALVFLVASVERVTGDG